MNKEERKTELLEIFINTFAENGIERTSIKKLSRAADINEASIYQYFTNKDEIIVDCVRQYFDDIGKEIFPVLTDENLPLERRLKQFILYYSKIEQRGKFILQVLADPVYGKMCSSTLQLFMEDIKDAIVLISDQTKIPEKSLMPLASLLYSVLTANQVLYSKNMMNMQLEYLMQLANLQKEQKIV